MQVHQLLPSLFCGFTGQSWAFEARAFIELSFGSCNFYIHPKWKCTNTKIPLNGKGQLYIEYDLLSLTLRDKACKGIYDISKQ